MTTSMAGSERMHGLDAVRGYALLLGIIFHASASFLPGPQVWIVADNDHSSVLSGVFFVSHIFRMTTFFLIAGFFAHMTFHRRGAKGFILDRLKRIGLPLVIFWPLMITGIMLAAGFAVYQATGVFPAKPPPAPPAPPGAFPLTHLWFLYVLLLLYVATLAVRALFTVLDRSGAMRGRIDRAVGGILRSPLAPVVLALPPATALYLFPGWLMWFGIPTPDSNLVPNAPAALTFFMAFALGWLVHRQPALLEVWRRRWQLNLAAAAAFTIACLAMVGLTPVIVPAPQNANKLAYATCYAIAVWTWTFAVIGLALRFLSSHSTTRRYIADSSYWLYLIHLPLVMALQAWVSRLEWPWEVKFIVILVAAFALMFASYQVLVRHTFLGGWLNGRRPQHPAKQSRIEPEIAR